MNDFVKSAFRVYGRNNMRLAKLLFIFSALILLVSGCVQMSVQDREPLPEIMWPKPPEIPRILFVNSVSKPEHLNMHESMLNKLFSIIQGRESRSIVRPYGIETDSEGRYFVVDNYNKYVHVFNTENGEYYTFPDNKTSLGSPIDIAVRHDGTVYVTDSKEAKIAVFGESGKKFLGEIGKEFLGRPTGIAINRKTGELLVVDTLNSQIVRYDVNSHVFIGTIGMTGDEKGMFHSPTNIFVCRKGRIYISDSLNFRIQIFSPEGKFMKSFGKAGNGPGYFSRPRGVAVDSDGNIYVVDALFDNVQVFNMDGELLMDFGRPGYGYGEFWLPSGIFIDGRDRIFVTDTYNKRIQIFQYLKEGEF